MLQLSKLYPNHSPSYVLCCISVIIVGDKIKQQFIKAIGLPQTLCILAMLKLSSLVLAINKWFVFATTNFEVTDYIINSPLFGEFFYRKNAYYA